LYCLVNAVRVIKSRGLRWAGYVARMEEDSSSFNYIYGLPKRKRLLEAQAVNYKMTLK